MGRLQEDYLAKERMVAHLPQGVLEGHSVINVSGGYGSGGTTSISSFVAKSGEYVIWAHFGSTSLYTDKFWHSFVRAMDGWDKNLANQLGTLPFPDNIADTSRFLKLLQETPARAGKAIFVFDGFHLIKDGPIKNLIINIVNACGAHYSTILIAQGENGLGEGLSVRVCRLDETDLVFTREEIRIYYTALGIVLERSTLDQICKLTEGVPSLVLLLGRYLHKGEALNAGSIDQAVSSLYTALERQYHTNWDTELYRSLILLGLLDWFTIDMAMELTSVSADQFYQITWKNPFVCYHTTDSIYSFYTLYRNFLHEKALEVPGKARSTFLRKAALLCEQKGCVIEPLKYYFSCGNYDQMIDVVRKNVSVVNLRPDLAAQIADQLSKIPEDYSSRHPEVPVYLMSTLTFSGQLDTVYPIRSALRKQLAAAPRSPENDRVMGEICLSEALQAWNEGSDAEYLRLLKKAHTLLPDGTAILGESPVLSLGGNVLRFLEMGKGQLLAMKDAAMAAVPYIRDIYPTNAYTCYQAASEAHMFRMEFAEARDYAGASIQEAVRVKAWGGVCENHYNIMEISMMEDSLSTVLYHYEQIGIYAKKLPPLYQRRMISLMNLRLYMFLKFYHLLEDWPKAEPVSNSLYEFDHGAGRYYYSHALYMFHVTKQYYPVISYIDQALPLCRQNGMWFTGLNLTLLKAAAYETLGQPNMASKYFVDAYRMSRDNNVILVFAEAGTEALDIIESAGSYLLEQGVPQEWIDKVKGLAGHYERQREQMALEYQRLYPQVAVRRLERLTLREYESLKLLCKGSTAKEIAAQMAVDESTVREYHIRVYRKLGVHQQADAVRVAITEGILGVQ